MGGARAQADGACEARLCSGLGCPVPGPPKEARKARNPFLPDLSSWAGKGGQTAYVLNSGELLADPVHRGRRPRIPPQTRIRSSSFGSRGGKAELRFFYCGKTRATKLTTSTIYRCASRGTIPSAVWREHPHRVDSQTDASRQPGAGGHQDGRPGDPASGKTGRTSTGGPRPRVTSAIAAHVVRTPDLSSPAHQVMRSDP